MNTKTMLKKYGFATLFCLVFNYIYSLFGHGVTSPFMSYAFVFSLVLGIGGYSVFGKLNLDNHIAYEIYNAGIATLTIGSLLRGVIEIAGADTMWSTYYFIAGTVLVVAGSLLVLYQWTQTRYSEVPER